ncbi:hypothetical protein NBRGN_099_00630 [Nocardia brasiliensis NBRC 14402]|nr:hypothetical protein CEQ30_15630 [Nocardia brasiliensis]GAJ85840.1 hypothetical protein NBRGN_099_00630 [Nocardia brasiliensis NBRC 14402]
MVSVAADEDRDRRLAFRADRGWDEAAAIRNPLPLNKHTHRGRAGDTRRANRGVALSADAATITW